MDGWLYNLTGLLPRHGTARQLTGLDCGDDGWVGLGWTGEFLLANLL